MAHDDEGRGPRADDANGLPRDGARPPWLPASPAREATAPASPPWRPLSADRDAPPRGADAPAVSIGGASASTPLSPPPPPPSGRRAPARADDADDPWRIVEAVPEPVAGAGAPIAAAGTVPTPTPQEPTEPAADALGGSATRSRPEHGDPVPPSPAATQSGAPADDDSRRRSRRLAAAVAVLGGVAVAAIIVATGFVAGWWGPRETTAAAPPVAATEDDDAGAGGEPRSDGTRPLQSPSTQPSASASAAAPAVSRAALVTAVYSAPAPAMCQHSAGSFANGVHHGSSPGGSRAGLHIANPDGSRVNQDGVDRFAATGDLTGDGVPEIAVAAWCEIGGETKPASVLVYTPTASGDLDLVGAQDLGDLSGTIRAWADTLTISNGVLHVAWDGPWGATQEKFSSVDFTVRGGSLVSSGYQESVRAR